MYVIIVGAGEVGRTIARLLVEEGHEVAVVELDEELARRLDSSLNALVVQGSGISSSILQHAGVERADLLLAVTSTDEVNLIACMTARKYGSERLRVVARVRESRDVVGELALSAEDLGLDALISPEQAITTATIEDLEYAGGGEMRELGGGRLMLVGMMLSEDSPLVHETLEELREDFPGEFLVVGVQGEDGRIPSGSDRLRPADRAFVLAPPGYLTELAILSGTPWYHVRRVLIVGCGNTGLALARVLEEREYETTIIEKDGDRAEHLSHVLADALVLQGDGSDPEFMRSRIERGRIDAVVVLLKDPEKSVLIGIFAKSLGARKVIVRCDKPAYARLAGNLGIDAVISPKRAMTDAILRYVRSGRIEATLLLGEQVAEIIRYTVAEKPKNREILEKPLRALTFPEGSLVGAVIREGQMFLGSGDTVLRAGDELFMVTLRDVLGEVERFLA
ncbi:MAG: Trk system potassium transporter TrkA [Acidobacteria bacterium]|nr:Trk system potassium transporter TrkA [Acidobacteriota bacterium]